MAQSQFPQTNIAAAQFMQRKRSFLSGLTTVFNQRNTPLPPALTGVPNPPGFDPSTSVWKALDVSPTDHGVIRLAGKEIDLYKLWALVYQAGGYAKVCLAPSSYIRVGVRYNVWSIDHAAELVGPLLASVRPTRTCSQSAVEWRPDIHRGFTGTVLHDACRPF